LDEPRGRLKKKAPLVVELNILSLTDSAYKRLSSTQITVACRQQQQQQTIFLTALVMGDNGKPGQN
jgi:hypothetical protein